MNQEKEKTMKSSARRIVSILIAAFLLSVSGAFAQSLLPPVAVPANNSITGSWQVNSTPDGAPPFRGLITFSEGGGMIASAQGDNLINAGSLATPGHGAWSRTGNREFLFTFVQILYNADGEHDGMIRIRHTATMNKSGNAWTGQLTLEVFDPGDNLVFTGTGSGTATRIVPLPLL
jgi:hypothetical protein